MNRSLKFERVYPLGEYKTLRLTDEINDLPDSVVSNPHAVDLIRTMQMIQSDLTFRRYLEQGKELSAFTTHDEVVKYLESLRDTTLDSYIKLIKNGTIQE